MKYPSRYQFDNVNAQNAIAIVAPGNLEDMLAYSRNYKRLQIPYIFDPGQSIPALTKEQLIEMITDSAVLISNDYELEMIKQSTGLGKTDLLTLSNTVITTLGEKGSLLSTSEEEVAISIAQPSEVSDPTGAGDAYRAGLIKGIILEKNLMEATRMGATCASYVVECYGTQEHRFTSEEFWNRYQVNFG